MNRTTKKLCILFVATLATSILLFVIAMHDPHGLHMNSCPPGNECHAAFIMGYYDLFAGLGFFYNCNIWNHLSMCGDIQASQKYYHTS